MGAGSGKAKRSLGGKWWCAKPFCSLSFHFSSRREIAGGVRGIHPTPRDTAARHAVNGLLVQRTRQRPEGQNTPDIAERPRSPEPPPRHHQGVEGGSLIHESRQQQVTVRLYENWRVTPQACRYPYSAPSSCRCSCPRSRPRNAAHMSTFRQRW